jgi:hypothetical protein
MYDLNVDVSYPAGTFDGINIFAFGNISFDYDEETLLLKQLPRRASLSIVLCHYLLSAEKFKDA